ncbi:nuclear transport factor 2 family protein [Nocardia xishanensis]|uniref:Nuclear transport factor 2 family protein n=1 Tax=Nocardia xishanensis TaxID=238964 RepID=A0ABW7X045_9NOCA
MTDTDVLDELLDLEGRGWDALCASSGADFYGALMTDDALMVLANGMVLDRAGVVDSLRHAPPWRTYEIQDPRLVHVGPAAAALIYVAVAYREGTTPAFRGVMSSVYLRTPDGWRLTCYQQTRFPEE